MGIQDCWWCVQSPTAVRTVWNADWCTVCHCRWEVCGGNREQRNVFWALRSCWKLSYHEEDQLRTTQNWNPLKLDNVYHARRKYLQQPLTMADLESGEVQRFLLLVGFDAIADSTRQDLACDVVGKCGPVENASCTPFWCFNTWVSFMCNTDSVSPTII